MRGCATGHIGIQSWDSEQSVCVEAVGWHNKIRTDMRIYVLLDSTLRARLVNFAYKQLLNVEWCNGLDF